MTQKLTILKFRPHDITVRGGVFNLRPSPLINYSLIDDRSTGSNGPQTMVLRQTQRPSIIPHNWLVWYARSQNVIADRIRNLQPVDRKFAQGLKPSRVDEMLCACILGLCGGNQDRTRKPPYRKMHVHTRTIYDIQLKTSALYFRPDTINERTSCYQNPDSSV